MKLNKKNIIGYILVLFVGIMILNETNIIDTKNYKDYESDKEELSNSKSIKLTSNDKPYCAGDGVYDPGFYDIKALGGSSENSDYSLYKNGYIKKGNFLNDIYISNTECLFVDGDIELIPSSSSSEKYMTDEFTINETMDLVVDKNIAPGEYEVIADIPEDTEVLISSNNENKIHEENYSVYLSNTKSLDNSGFKNIKFDAKKNDVISVELQSGANSKYYSSFPVTIKKIN